MKYTSFLKSPGETVPSSASKSFCVIQIVTFACIMPLYERISAETWLSMFDRVSVTFPALPLPSEVERWVVL